MRYDHLVGTMGVPVTEALAVRDGLAEITDGYSVTATAARHLGEIGLDIGVVTFVEVGDRSDARTVALCFFACYGH